MVYSIAEEKYKHVICSIFVCCSTALQKGGWSNSKVLKASSGWNFLFVEKKKKRKKEKNKKQKKNPHYQSAMKDIVL